MENKMIRSCVDCAVGNCDEMTKHFPAFCLTTHMEQAERDAALSEYQNEENARIMHAAARTEYENYCKMTRVEETAAFCKEMGYRKIGIATCVGLLHEANICARILRAHGFEVYGIACKAGTVPKHEVGIPACCEEIGENICNPTLQARTLNREHTDFNVVIGLCVGHDSLFYKYSEAPASTLIAKDRVLGHNPVAALYQTKAYYSRLLKPES